MCVRLSISSVLTSPNTIGLLSTWRSQSIEAFYIIQTLSLVFNATWTLISLIVGKKQMLIIQIMLCLGLPLLFLTLDFQSCGRVNYTQRCPCLQQRQNILTCLQILEKLYVLYILCNSYLQVLRIYLYLSLRYIAICLSIIDPVYPLQRNKFYSKDETHSTEISSLLFACKLQGSHISCCNEGTNFVHIQ